MEPRILSLFLPKGAEGREGSKTDMMQREATQTLCTDLSWKGVKYEGPCGAIRAPFKFTSEWLLASIIVLSLT